MEFIIIAVLIGLIPAIVAKNKGYNFFGFWIYGALLFIIALPHALLIKPNQTEIDARALSEGGRKCPYCAEIIKAEAVICRFCHKDLPKIENAPQSNEIMDYNPVVSKRGEIIIAIFVAAGIIATIIFSFMPR